MNSFMHIHSNFQYTCQEYSDLQVVPVLESWSRILSRCKIGAKDVSELPAVQVQVQVILFFTLGASHVRRRSVVIE